MVVSSLHAVYIHFANKNKLKMSMQLSKNMIKNHFTIFCKQMSIFVNISSNFLHTIFRPQATISTENPLNPAKIGAKTTPLFYKIRIEGGDNWAEIIKNDVYPHYFQN